MGGERWEMGEDLVNVIALIEVSLYLLCRNE